MGKFHMFDIDVAKEYGVNAAILLYNISHWIDKNKANNQNFHDGKYWTYNSAGAFVDLFPYMTEKSVRYALQKLIDGELIITGNYNKAYWDRTMWYALTEKGTAICENCNAYFTNAETASSKIVTPIPDNKHTDNKPDNKPYNNTFSNEKVCRADAQRVISAWNDLPSVPKVQRLMSTSTRYKMMAARIRDYGVDDVLRAIENVRRSPFLLGNNRNGWQITFDWFVKPNNFPKVLDGNYLDSKAESVEETSVSKGRLTANEIDNMGGTY